MAFDFTKKALLK